MLFSKLNKSNAFIMTINTNLGVGASMTFPTFGGGQLFDIDWGDGNFDTAQTTSITHTYASHGIYQLKVTGILNRVYFNIGGDKDKVVSIDNWGIHQWIDMTRAFAGCSNLVYNATDVPNLSICTNIRQMFNLCPLFNGAIGNWDVSNINNMFNALRGCTSFNQNLGSWNMANVNNTSNFLADIGGSMSTTNYDALLNGWASQILQVGNSLTVSGTQYSVAGAAARAYIISTYGWTISDAGLAP